MISFSLENPISNSGIFFTFTGNKISFMKIVKTSFLILLMSFITSTAIAQDDDTNASPTDQGSWLITAGSNAGLNFSSSFVDFNGQESEKDKLSSFTISSSAGYFVDNNLVAGAQISYGTSKITDGDSNFEARNSSIAAGPFLRNYFGEGNFRPFVGASILFGSAKDESVTASIFDSDPDFGTSEVKSSSTIWGLSAGAALFIANNFSIDFELGYANSTRKPDNDEDDFKVKSNNFGLNIGFSLFL
jgi:outer membrane protein